MATKRMFLDALVLMHSVDALVLMHSVIEKNMERNAHSNILYKEEFWAKETSGDDIFTIVQ